MESKIPNLISPIGQQLDGIANQGDGQGAWTKMKPKRRVSNTQIESKATICDAISAHMYNIYNYIIQYDVQGNITSLLPYCHECRRHE